MDYKILTGESFKSTEYAIRELEREVKSYMKEGWKPQGGVSITKFGSSSYIFTVAQAMIKEERN